jgi:AmmeMemoRadiSam system protein A
MKEKKEILLKLARESIEHRLSGKEITVKKDDLEEFSEDGATFVTLNKHGNLRGCIGSIIAHRKLYDDIIHNAQSAAFGDPRFPALNSSEYDDLDVEVSILTAPKPLPYSDVEDLRAKIKVGVHGVIIKSGHHQATFLPQVWEQLPDFDQFFAHLCNKAGMHASCLNSHPDVLTYEVEKYK